MADHQRVPLTRSHEGRVVSLFTRVERIMSDVYDDVWYAVVADDAAGTSFREVYAGAGYDGGRDKEHGCVDQVDASADLQARYAVWTAEQRVLSAQREREAAARKAAEGIEREARTPRNGRRVRVVRGRKVAHGTEGVVMWYGETRYGWRVGIKVGGQADPVWTDAGNVDVVTADTPAYVAPVAPAKAKRARKAKAAVAA